MESDVHELTLPEGEGDQRKLRRALVVLLSICAAIVGVAGLGAVLSNDDDWAPQSPESPSSAGNDGGLFGGLPSFDLHPGYPLILLPLGSLFVAVAAGQEDFSFRWLKEVPRKAWVRILLLNALAVSIAFWALPPLRGTFLKEFLWVSIKGATGIFSIMLLVAAPVRFYGADPGRTFQRTLTISLGVYTAFWMIPLLLQPFQRSVVGIAASLYFGGAALAFAWVLPPVCILVALAYRLRIGKRAWDSRRKAIRLQPDGQGRSTQTRAKRSTAHGAAREIAALAVVMAALLGVIFLLNAWSRGAAWWAREPFSSLDDAILGIIGMAWDLGPPRPFLWYPLLWVPLGSVFLAAETARGRTFRTSQVRHGATWGLIVALVLPFLVIPIIAPNLALCEGCIPNPNEPGVEFDFWLGLPMHLFFFGFLGIVASIGAILRYYGGDPSAILRRSLVAFLVLWWIGWGIMYAETWAPAGMMTFFGTLGRAFATTVTFGVFLGPLICLAYHLRRWHHKETVSGASKPAEFAVVADESRGA